MADWMELESADGNTVRAYQATPQGEIKGAVVVVQEIFGVNAHIRSVADRLAAAGYLATAPSLFDRFERGVELKYEGEDLQKAFALYGKLDVKTALLDVAAAFAKVREQGKGVAVVGFCYGGLLSWLSATRGEEAGMHPACCVGYYPGGIGGFASEEPSCPVMLHFGAEDTHIGKDQSDAVRAAHPEVTIYSYEHAGHGFNNDMRDSFAPEAAKLAWERTREFLATHIG